MHFVGSRYCTSGDTCRLKLSTRYVIHYLCPVLMQVVMSESAVVQVKHAEPVKMGQVQRVPAL